MPKLKLSDDDLNLKELEDAEYSEEDYQTYDGEIPNNGTVLSVYVRKAWWTYTQNEDPMLKILLVAAENEGDEEDFNDLPIWENMALLPSTKWRWAPFLRVMGLTLRDLKTKTVVSSDDDPNMGAPIEKIADWEPGEDSDTSWCRIAVKKEKYNGEWNAKVGKWLAKAAEDEDEDAEKEEPDPPAKPSRKSTKAAPEPEDDEEDDEDDDEDDDEEDDEEDDEDEAPSPPPVKAKRVAAKPAPRKTLARGKHSTAAAANDPPF